LTPPEPPPEPQQRAPGAEGAGDGVLDAAGSVGGVVEDTEQPGADLFTGADGGCPVVDVAHSSRPSAVPTRTPTSTNSHRQPACHGQRMSLLRPMVAGVGQRVGDAGVVAQHLAALAPDLQEGHDARESSAAEGSLPVDVKHGRADEQPDERLSERAARLEAVQGRQEGHGQTPLTYPVGLTTTSMDWIASATPRRAAAWILSRSSSLRPDA